MDGAMPANFSPPGVETQDDDAFLADVRAFLDQALTPDLRLAGRRTLGVHAEIGACRIWYRRLYQRGWIAPAWPAACVFPATRWSIHRLRPPACWTGLAPVAAGSSKVGPPPSHPAG